MDKLKLTKERLILLLAGIFIGLLLFTAFRFVVIKDDTVHYHADFAFYLNGQKDEFKSFTFYEEIAACDAHDADNSKGRAHLHNQNNHLVHVHADGITWGYFFANLGYTLGDTIVKTDSGAYIDGQDGNQLTFLLNGQKIDAIATRVIHSEDVLLINYGKDDDKTLQSRYDTIPHDAHKANVTADPAACSGSQKWTLTTRLKKALGLDSSGH
jgi:hypothetical protein